MFMRQISYIRMAINSTYNSDPYGFIVQICLQA